MVYDIDMRAEKAKTYFPPPNTVKYIISKQSLKQSGSLYNCINTQTLQRFTIKMNYNLSSRKSFESVVEIVLEICASRL